MTRTSDDNERIDDDQLYAVASGKGGVGKTTTVVNLGVVLRQSNHSVALVDADVQMPNLGAMLGVEHEPTLQDVLAGDATVEDAVAERADGFGVLPGDPDVHAYPDADPSHLPDVLAPVVEAYDYVLMDTGAGLSVEAVLPLEIAGRVILVTSPDPAAIENTRRTAELAGLSESHIEGVLVTNATESTVASDVAAMVGADLLGVIPVDLTLMEAAMAGQPVELVDPEAPAVEAYHELGATLTGEVSDTSLDPPETVEPLQI